MPTKPTGRPRGRPKGARNIPTLDVFVVESTAAPRHIRTPEPRKAARGPCVNMTAEERSAYFKALAARRTTPNKGVNGRKAGVPRHLTAAQHEAQQAAQQPIIARIIKKMAANEQLPDDPMAVEALKEAMTVLRSEIPARDKIAAARLVLDFTKSKPTAKVEHTVKTAEDFLDDLAAGE